MKFSHQVYWLNKLKDFQKATNLIPDLVSHIHEFEYSIMEEIVPAGLSKSISKLGKDSPLSIFIIGTAITNVLLYKLTREETIVIGLPTYPSKKNTTFIPIFTPLHEGLSFKEILLEIKENVIHAYKHQDISFEELAALLSHENKIEIANLFNIIFQSKEIHDSSSENYPKGTNLIISIEQSSNNTRLKVTYNSHNYNEHTIKNLIDKWIYIAEYILENPNVKISKIKWISEQEEHLILEDFYYENKSYPVNIPLHIQFEKQVFKTPNKIAVICEETSLTYKALNTKANKLARKILDVESSQNQNNQFVGIYKNRGVDFLVAILAILKTGKAFIPLDPTYPEKRVSYMIAQSECTIVIGDSDVSLKFKDPLHGLSSVIFISDQDSDIQSYPSEDLVIPVSSKDPIYMMYTSGSTGLPKGAILRHDGVINHIYAQFEFMQLTSDLIFLQSAPTSSDISVWQYLSPILVGGTVVVVDKNTLLNPEELFNVIEHNKVTIIEFVPQLLDMFVNYMKTISINKRILPSLKWIMVTGETVSVSLFNSILEYFPNVKVANAYGPTEASDDIIQFNTSDPLPQNAARVPIGKPLPNVRIHILDENYSLVPIGAPGEIYVTGIAVGSGYWKDIEKTRSFFINDPFFPGQIMYRTGDAGRWLPSGEIEFLGRIDTQLKIRGFRIEPSDIEHEVLKYKSVKQCVVVAQQSQEGVSQQLVAYLVLQETIEWDPSLFRDWLQTKLPQYMIPTKFISVDKIPLTPSGKIDRVSLANSNIKEKVEIKSSGPAQPRTSLEKALHEIWSEILQTRNIGIYDNFFDLGGDSIQSIQIVAKAKTKGINITPKDIFENLTIEKIAKLALGKVAEPKTSKTVSGPIPLTPIQNWFFELDLQNPNHFNQAVILNLDLRLSYEITQQLIHEIILHHDALRMYIREGNNLAEIIQPDDLSINDNTLLFKDLSNLKNKEQEHAIEEYAAKLQKEINIYKPFLFKFAFIKTGESKPARLVLIIHHLLVDGISWRILLDDLYMGFQQLLNNEKLKLIPPSTSFGEWSYILQKIASEKRTKLEMEYWEGLIRNLSVENNKTLLYDQQFKSGKIFESTIHITEETTKKFLNYVPNLFKARNEEIFLAVWLETLFKTMGRNSVYIDMESHGRDLTLDTVDLTRTFGWFTSLYPLHLQRKKGWDYFDLIQEVKFALFQVPRQGISYGLVRYLNGNNTLSADHSSGLRFNYVGELDSTLPTDGLYSISKESPGESIGSGNFTKYVLDVNIGFSQSRIFFNIVYNDIIFTSADIEKISERIKEEIDSIIKLCETSPRLSYNIFSMPQNDISRNDVNQIVIGETEIEDVYPLTPMQRAILFHNTFHASKGLNSQQIYWIFEGNLQVQVFQKAWQMVIKAHPILRTSFRWRKLKEPIQILYKQVPLDFEYLDWSTDYRNKNQNKLNDIIKIERENGINPTKSPLTRFKLIRLSNQEYFFMFSYSTSLFDNWSWRNIMGDVIETYEKLCVGANVQISNNGHLVDYVKWVYSKKNIDSRIFWTDELSSIKLENLKISNSTNNQKFVPQETEIKFNIKETQMAEKVSKRYGMTLNSLLQAAWALTWCCYYNSNDILYGILSSGRSSEVPNIDKISGPLSNFIPMRSKLTGEIKLIDWIRNIQSTQIEALQHDYVSPEQIAKWTNIPLKQIQHAIYERSFVFVGDSDESILKPISKRDLNIRGISNSLNHNVPFRGYASKNSTLLMSIKFDEQKYSTSQVNLWLKNFKSILNFMVNNIELKIKLEQLIQELSLFVEN